MASEQQVMALYSDHSTSEQFHSEFKTDLDLERLRSGKFDTNNLVMAFATMGYNVLRWMGLRLTLMTMACRLVHSGRQWILRFGRHCPDFAVYCDLYERIASSG